MNSTLTIDTAHAGECSSAAYELCITGLNGVRASATIWPTALTLERVSGVVEWQDPMCLSSIVCTEGDSSAWMQRILLVWAAAGPKSIRFVPELAAAQWASLRVKFPVGLGDPRELHQIALCRSRWCAVFSYADPNKLKKHLLIPMELRQLDAGSLVLAMASRVCSYQSLSTKQRPNAGDSVGQTTFD